MNRRFEILGHTADKGIIAYGHDPKELFENAAYGMFSLMAELDQHVPTETREIEFEAGDQEELLRAWLAELLYQFEVDRILFLHFEVREISDVAVRGIARGIAFSSDIVWLGSAVKAVTHHDLHVRQTDGNWEAQVIFDV